MSDDDVPDDVLTALEYLRRTFPAAYHPTYVEPPLILVSQVYALIEDRTAVDRRVRELVQRRSVVVFDIPAAGINERALLFTDDYRSAVLALVPPTSAPQHDDDNDGAAYAKRRRRDGDNGAAIVAVFVDSLIPALTSSTLTDDALVDAFAVDRRTAAVPADDVRAAVIAFGLVIRHRTSGTYYLAAPHTAHIIGDLLAGRHALAAIIRRRRSRQISLDAIEALNGGRLNKSQRGSKWTLLDMIGTNRLTVTQTDRARIVTLPT